MGTTAHGLHYPDPANLVKDGALAIQTLAADIEYELWGGAAVFELAGLHIHGTNGGDNLLSLRAAPGQAWYTHHAEWLDEWGTLLGAIWADGRVLINPGKIVNFDQAHIDAALMVSAMSANDIPVVIRAFAAQAADITQWQIAGGARRQAVSSAGHHRAFADDGNTVVAELAAGDAGSGNSRMTLMAQAVGCTPLTVFGANGQTAALASLWRNVSGTSTLGATVTAGGNVQGTGAYTTLSDERSKANISALQLDPVDVIRRLRPVHFDYVDGEADQVGFVAQDVADVLPPAVVPFAHTADADADVDQLLGVRDGAITAYLVGALQKALDRIEHLEGRVAALEGKTTPGRSR